MFIFDTDILSASLKRVPPPRLVQRIARVNPEDQATTSITVGELSYGAQRVGRLDLWARIELLLAGLTIVDFDRRAAETYGALRARLEADGRRLAEADLRIAAIALTHRATLVTGNTRHFERIEGLEVEDWR